MPDSFARFRCWTSDRVQESVFGDIASLGLDADAVFLAAHTSLDIRHIKGAHIDAGTPEQGVLHALTASFGLPSENTVIAITGASGSGKSHLVRWLRAHLTEDADRYHLIYVPRELATLRDLIGRVLDGMPASPAADAVRDELEKAVAKKAADQLAEELLDKLRSVVSYELPDATEADRSDVRPVLLGRRAGDGTSRRENGLADLLLVRPIREHVLRDDGAIGGIIASLRGQRSGRDEEVPEFVAADLKIRRTGITSQLDDSLRSVWNVVQRAPDAACALLNEALPRAVAETLGMRAGVNLGEVFRTARAQLRDQKKDLVLLFEDLAQFGLFDGELFDQFVLQPGEALAPIRAVFAITDGKFKENVPDTVQTRLAHRFEIGSIEADSDADTALIALLARYLNVARVGRRRLVAAWNGATADERVRGSWIPNACWDLGGTGECAHRETCWPSFGTADDIGLYPYNRVAIRRAVTGSSEAVTPRVVVDSFVHDFLLEADVEIDAAEFPSDGVRERFDFSVALSKDAIVPRSKLPEEVRDRVHRCRVIWADGGVEAPGITEAFSLPTLDGSVLTDDEDDEDGGGERPAPSKLRPLTPLFAWENGEPLPNREAVFYRDALYALATSRVDLNSMLIDAGTGPAGLLLRRVVTPNSFEFSPDDPGRPAGKNQMRFEILPTGRGVRLLSAVRWFWDHAHWNTTDKSRKWDFPGDAREAEFEFEEFLDDCARQIEGAIVACMLRGPLDPAAAAVALRTVALRILGRDIPESADSLNRVLNDSAPFPVATSPEWTPVASAAAKALAHVDSSWVTAFATARQGETGDPQAVDTARLAPALRQARVDPLGSLSGDGTFDEAFSALAEHWIAVRDSLKSSAGAERAALAALVDEVVDVLAGLDMQAAVPEIESAGRLAADNNAFRPHNLYELFRAACERLRLVASEEVHEWVKARTNMPVGPEAVAAVVAAQTWAPRARQVRDDLRVVAECLGATSTEVEERLAHDVGETPEQVVGRIASQLSTIDGVISGIGSPS